MGRSKSLFLSTGYFAYKEFNLKPEIFDAMEEEDRHKEAVEFLTAVTSEAVSAGEKSREEKEKVVAKLNERIEQLPDSPETEGCKSYFLMLLAYVNDEDYKLYMDKVPEELKELFEEIRTWPCNLINVTTDFTDYTDFFWFYLCHLQYLWWKEFRNRREKGLPM
jgi:hypothetical protein